jgi:protein required for attachment to host cells
MENSKTWLLIANASKAKLYSFHKAALFQHQDPKALTLVNEFSHDKSRKKNSELSTDRMGRLGAYTSGLAEATPPKTHEAEVFAIELVNHLDEARTENKFRDLIIIAPAAFMGMMSKHTTHEIEKMIAQKIEKDYTSHTNHELMHNLMQHF